MQVTWIETFLTIVDRGGFCAAADSLFRSQSRVSAHIASLEVELGAPLFDRRQRPVMLTAAGRAFLNYAIAAKSSLDAGAAAVRAVEESGAGRIALGSYPSASATFVPPLLSAFSRACPSFHVEIVEQSTPGLDDALVSGRVAIALRPRLPFFPGSGLNREPLWCERMMVVVPRDHRFARVDEIDVAALADEPLITTGANTVVSTEASIMLRDANVDPEVAFVSDHPQTLVALVARGLGVGFTNRLALDAVRTDDVVIIELSEPIYRVVDVCWLGDIENAPAAQALLEAIRRARIPAGTSKPRRAADMGLRLLKSESREPQQSHYDAAVV